MVTHDTECPYLDETSLNNKNSNTLVGSFHENPHIALITPFVPEILMSSQGNFTSHLLGPGASG